MHQESHATPLDTAATITIDTDRPATLPAVECAPWCEADDGHTDAWHVEDQWCRSDQHRSDLTAEPLNTHKGKVEGRSYLHTHMGREAYSTRTLVHLSHNDGPTANLTIDEAERLAAVLLDLVKAERA